MTTRKVQTIPLLAAIDPPNPEELRARLEAGDSPDTADAQGMAALALASAAGSADLVELLIEFGAAVNAADSDTGMTPLFHAADARGGGDVFADHVATIDRLLAGGADPNVATRWGETPLMRAIQRRRIDLALKLAPVTTNVAQRDFYGRTAIDYATRLGAEGLELFMYLEPRFDDEA